jgi:hypothetical protein
LRLLECRQVSRVGPGQTTITVVVNQPEVEHKVCMRNFEAWLESSGRFPAEMALKSRLRGLLCKYHLTQIATPL